MKAPRYGISLLDVVVAIALAAILSTLIFQSLQQTRHAVKKIEATIDINSMLIHFRERVLKDIQGAFIPQKITKKIQAQQPNQHNEINKNAPQQEPAKKDPSQEQVNDFKLERINFSIKSDAKEHGSLNFITTNALTIYNSVTPRAVRIQYVLKKHKDKDVWQLVRSESPELDYKKFTEQYKNDSNKGIVILSNIETFEITCYAPKTENKKQEPQAAAQTQEKSKQEDLVFSEYKIWDSDEQISNKKPALPGFVQIKGSVIDENSKSPVEFSFLIPIEATASDDDENSQQNALNKLSELLGIPTPDTDRKKNTPQSSRIPYAPRS